MTSMTSKSEMIGTVGFGENAVAADTRLLVFFLAVEIGQNGRFWSLDTVALGMALAAAMFLPFYFIEAGTLSFGRWAGGRVIIAGFALMLGGLYGASVGTLLPEVFGYVPFSLLIAAAVFTSVISFRNLLLPRYAR